MKNKRTPDIRFEGCTEDWEQCKLGEVFEQSSEYVNPKVESLELWSLTVEKGLTPKTERYNREFLVKKEDQFKAVSNNEFIYNPMNMTLGAVDLNLTGKKVAVSGYYITMKTTDNYDSKYFGIWLKTPLAIRMYKSFATGSLIERQRVQFQTLSQIKASVPSKEEQTKIGDFFKQMDDTISLYQRELTTLKQTKQGFLQKMFPKEGDNVPEVRFPGFTGDWKYYKLEDVAEFNPKSNLPEQFEYVDLESVVGIKLISHRTEQKETAPSRAQRLAKQGDVFYQTVRPYQKNNYLFDLQFDNYVFSTGYAQMRPNIDSYFLLSRLQEERFVSNVLDRCTGTSYPAINSTDLAQIEISVPKLKEEQNKIGNFFKQLDETITLHQREVDALQETKKAFLQKMFV